MATRVVQLYQRPIDGGIRVDGIEGAARALERFGARAAQSNDRLPMQVVLPHDVDGVVQKGRSVLGE